MNPNLNINEIIFEFDANEESYSYGFYEKGVFISCWHLVRNHLHNILLAMSGVDVFKPQRKRKFWRDLTLLIDAFKHRPRKTTSVDVLFFFSQIKNMDRGKFVYNIDHGLMAEEVLNLGKSVSVLGYQDGRRHRVLEPPLESKVLNWYIMQEKILLRFKRVSSQEKHTMSEFLDLLYIHLITKLPVEDVSYIVDELAIYLKRRVLEFKLKVHTWSKVLDLYSPKYLISHYLSDDIFLSLVAKARGIKVIETQHGYIYEESIYYNYNTNIKYLGFIPDYCWVYGKSSVEFIKQPFKKVVIGKPHLTEKMMVSETSEKEYDFLIISDSTSKQLTIDVGLKLLTVGDKLLFRKHPGQERNCKKSKYEVLLSNQKVYEDKNIDVCDSVLQSAAIVVVGNYISTIAFEALALGSRVALVAGNDKPIVGVGEGYISVIDYKDKEFSQKMSAFLTSKPKEMPVDDLFSLKWRENIKDFFAVN